MLTAGEAALELVSVLLVDVHFGESGQVKSAVADFDDTQVVDIIKHIVGENAVAEGIDFLGGIPAHFA